MNIELEEVEKGVGDEVDCAIYLALRTVIEFERLVGFAADGEGDPVEVSAGVFDMLSRFTG